MSKPSLIDQLDIQFETMHDSAKIMLNGINELIELNMPRNGDSIVVRELREQNFTILESILRNLQGSFNKSMAGF